MGDDRFSRMHCSLARTLASVGDAWSQLILRDIWLGVRRFDDIVTNLGISRNLLASRLKDLAADGVITATRYSARPPRNEYSLTDAGRELVPPLLALMAWGDRWRGADAGAPLLVRHRSCGCITRMIVACEQCGEVVSGDDVTVEAGPGGAAAPGTTLIAMRLAVRAGAQTHRAEVPVPLDSRGTDGD